MKKTKYLAWLVILAMVITMLPATVFAGDIEADSPEALSIEAYEEEETAPVVDEEKALFVEEGVADEEIITLDFTNNTGMFKAVSASASLNADGSVVLTMALSGTGYHYLYKGTYDQAVANGDAIENWIEGYQNDDGKWEFRIPFAAEELGTDVPVVAISQSYYEKYLAGQNPVARAFFPRQLKLDLDAATLVTGDYDGYETVSVTNNVSMFSVASARVHTIGGPNSNNYEKTLEITMGSASFSKVALCSARKADEAEQYDIIDKVEVFPLESLNAAGEIQASVIAGGDRTTTSWWSVKNQTWYERDLTYNDAAKTLVFDNTVKTVDTIDELGSVEALKAALEDGSLVATPEMVDDMIAAIQVQYADEKTDFYCAAAKILWDALTEEEQDKVDEKDYFGLDTGDASLDDPLNANEIGENEILVVSFGTSFNDSRVATIGAIEKAIAAAYPDWSVRRAFTAQIIINHICARDGETIDNVEQALDRAEANGVKKLVIQPTHLMHGAEYDDLVAALAPYQEKMTIIVSEPLLGKVGASGTDLNEDKLTVAEAVVAAADVSSDTALVLMGHGTAHEANITYTQMQAAMTQLGYNNVFVGTVEGEPEGTDAESILAAVKAAGYSKVVLRPLMVVAGDHANNDMADPEDEESWYSVFVADEAFTEETVTCQIAGLGEIKAVQDLYVSHVADAIEPADYSRIDAVLAMVGELVPEGTDIYTEDSIKALNDAIAAVDRTLPRKDQDQVEAMADAIVDAADALVVKELAYKDNGVKFIKASGEELGMWAVQEGTTAAFDGDNVIIHFVPKNKTTYAGFAYGSITRKIMYDKEKQPALDVAVNEDGSLDFSVSKQLCGCAVPISVVKKEFKKGKETSFETWTSAEQYFLAIPAADTLTDFTAVGEALKKVPANLLIYTEESLQPLTDALAAIDYTKTDKSEIDAMAQAVLDGVDGLVKKEIAFTVSVNGKEITEKEIIENGYDASYENFYTGEWFEDHVPLIRVWVPEGTETAEISLNNYADEYQCYHYVKSPPGYEGFLDYAFGDEVAPYTYIAYAGAQYTTKVDVENLIRVQSAYVELPDGSWQSFNLYAIEFVYPQAQKLDITTKDKSISYATTSAGDKTYKLITVKGNKGTLSYTKSSGKSYFTVDKTTGKITIKKGTPVGEYTVKVKVKAAATNRYKAASKTVSLKITVTQAKQTVKVTPVKKTQSVKYNKTKDKTIKNAVKVTGNKTALSYKITKTKYFKISSKGVITVKAGTPKGKYEVTVTATAKETKNYKKGSGKATFTIKVTK